MKQLRVLMASAEELVEPIFRKAIEEGSHHLTILNPSVPYVGETDS